jgi:DNA polymerase-3 subunit epsilon
MENSFVALDVETAQGKRWSICQIGLVFFENNVITKTISEYIQPPKNEYFHWNIKIHGITPEITKNKPYFPEVWDRIYPLIKNQKLVAHNASFDKSCLKQTLTYYNIDIPNFNFECTYKMSGEKLNIACESLDIPLYNHHDATCDAKACGLLYLKLNQKNYVDSAISQPKETKNEKNQLKNKFAQKLLEKGSMELDGISISFWTGHNKENNATRYNWNKVKSCSFYNQQSEGTNGHIVVTGIMQIPRHEILEYAAKLGLKVHSRVTLETDLVVLGSDNVSPNKIADALKLIKKGHHVEFLDEVAFLEIVLENMNIDYVHIEDISNDKVKKQKKVTNKKKIDSIKVSSNKLKGQTFVISGTFEKYSRDELKELISKYGGKNTGSISAKTNFLLAGENIGPSKLEKVKKLNIPIITENDFIKMIEE